MATVFQPCKTEVKDRFYPCEKTRCGHKWTVRYREPGGKLGSQREKSFPLKGSADDFATKVENDKREGVYLDPSRGKVPLHAYTLEWVERHPCSESTRRNYRSFFVLWVNPTIGRKTLGGVTTGDVAKVQAAMVAAGLAASTINARIGIALSGMFSAAVAEKRIRENPCSDVEPLKTAAKAVDPDGIPTTEQVHAIAAAIAPLYRFSVYCMSGAGMRTGEMLGYGPDENRGDFARLRHQISVYMNKGNSLPSFAPLKHRTKDDYRDVPLADFLIEEAAAHVERFPPVKADGVEVYFAGHGRTVGEWPHPATFNANFRRTVVGLGLVDKDGKALFSPHALRHYFASTAIGDGVPILEVSRWLGHTSIQITADIYGHLTPGATPRLRSVMDAALRPPVLG